MRYTIALVFLLSAPSFAPAQPKPKYEPIAIKKIQVGFRTYKDELDQSAYKAGLWTPIYIEIFGGTDGVDKKPGYDDPYLEITTNDSEDVGTTIAVRPVNVQPLQTRTVVGYVKTGHTTNNGGGEVNVKLHVNGRKITPQPYAPSFNVNIDAHVYLTLGPRVEDFHRAVKKIGLQGQGDKDKDFEINRGFLNNFYNVVYENDVERLPEVWFGYNGIDLMVLTTDKREFLTALNLPNNAERLKAIAQWVRRGGRLVVPIAPQTQDAAHALLTNPAAWTPTLSVVPPRVSANIQLERVPVANWAGVGEAFSRKDNGLIPVATLDPGRVAPGDWDVRVRTDERDGGQPLVASLRYGLGQITYVAFSLQDEHFFAWQAGKEKFMQQLVKECAPKAPAKVQDQFDGRFRDGRVGQDDPAGQLLVQLDKFGVTVIDFGYVALFILLYIIIVGPLDFFLLKYVFKRLEWTWITFPAVVLAVSVIAYFAAYFLKGKDLKVNKIDVVDFDLRTSKEQPRVYGHSFFTVLSPRIQNYTVGLEPNPEFWGGEAKKPLSVDLMSWMGRPSGGFNGMDRGGSGGFFRNAYQYNLDDNGHPNGLRGVPIPVWTTKAFMASWEHPLTKAPFDVDLTWHRDKEVKISGKLDNHLGVDLVDAWLIFEDRFYQLEGGLKSVKKGAAPLKLNLAANVYDTVDKWVFRNDAHDDVPGDAAANAQQTIQMKQMLFHERWDTQHTGRNHLLRPLDLGGRIKDDKLFGQRDVRTREVILFARVRPPVGDSETLTQNAQNPLPTKLWLGDLPNDERRRPTLSGQLNQDTYIRVLLPLRPEE